MSIEDILKNRRSYRNYTNQELALIEIEDVLKNAQRTATAINGQQISVVITSDQKKLDQIAEINWGQQHIKDAKYFLTFIVDFNRSAAHVDDIVIQNHIESIIVGAIDAGLLAQSIELLLHNKQIGTCMIGGIRNDMLKMREILEIEGLAFPILGMTVGHVNNFMGDPKKIRPRVDANTYYFKEKYQKESVESGSHKYNEELDKWWKKQDIESKSYKESMKNVYSKNYAEKEFEQFQKMGFLNAYQEKTDK